MVATAEKWARHKARHKKEIKLANEGFDVQRRADFVDYGTHHFIADWFRRAALIEKFAGYAMRRLARRNRRTGMASYFAGKQVGKETQLYGIDLPKLYERTTGKKFGIVKDRYGGTVKNTTGTAFVCLAAQAIGRPVTPANVADHFNKAKRHTRDDARRHAVPARKKSARATRHTG